MTEPAETSADGERKKLAGRAGVVAAGTLASRLLGLLRDMVIAAVFGRDVNDAFFVAFTIPNALRQLFAEGAVSSAVVPVLGKKLEESDAAAATFHARVRGLWILLLLGVTALGMLFARPLTELFASGYHERPAQFERTVSLTRAVFPYSFFMGMAALGGAALNAKRRFLTSAFAPGLLNVAFLVSAFALPTWLAARGTDVAMTLAIGALFGGFLQVIAQWPALARIGFGGRPRFDFWGDRDVGDMLKRIAPMTFGIGVYYIDLVLSRRFLSELGEGSQSYFSWASRLCDFPQGIFVMAISTAALPALSSLAARGDHEELKKTFAHGLRLSLFVAIPCSFALAALGEPLVALLFQRGKFDAIATHETARALVFQGGSIWTVAVVRQLVPVFYALGDTRKPVIVSALDLIAFIVLAMTLKGPLGHVGISVAVGGSSFVQMLLLWFALRARLGPLVDAGMRRSVGSTVLASVVAAVGGAGTVRLVGMASAWQAGIASSFVFVALFLLLGYGLKSPDQEALFAALRRRLGRRPISP